jgi:hypothetical protein
VNRRGKDLLLWEVSLVFQILLRQPDSLSPDSPAVAVFLLLW